MLKSDDLFFVTITITTPTLSAFQVIGCPVFFVNLAATKLDFHWGVTPSMVSPGAVSPPPQ